MALIFAVGGIRAVAGASAQGQSSGSVTQDQKDAVLSACRPQLNEQFCGVSLNFSSGDPQAWWNAAGCLKDHPAHFTTACIAAFNATCGRVGDACAGVNQTSGRGNPAVVAARQKVFGIENVDASSGAVRADKVIFSWITNASFAASVLGRVILLDTFVTRLWTGTNPGRTPFVIDDLINLQPEALFIGHGHFDHADNAAYIAGKTGATIYASPETCDNMQLDAAKIFGNGSAVNCVGVTSRGSLPGSEVVTLRQLEPVAAITAFKHLHSTNTAPQDTKFPPVIMNSLPTDGGSCPPNQPDGGVSPCNVANPREAALFPLDAGTPQSAVKDISTSRAGFGGPISIFYHFVVRGGNSFTFDWHNTTGALREGCALPNNFPADAGPPDAGGPSQPGQNAQGCFGPDVGEKLAKLMESLRPTDVEIGSVVSLGFAINGERDIVDYNTHIAPLVFIPNHVTAVAVEGSSLEWKTLYLRQQDAMGIPQGLRPELMWLVDPNDYLRPIVFDPKDDRWQKNEK